MTWNRLLIAQGFAATLLALTAMPIPAHADERPSPEVRAQIETYLRAQGFTRWDEIESEDGGRVWKVEDARHTDGRKYSVRLDRQSLQEVNRRLDD